MANWVVAGRAWAGFGRARTHAQAPSIETTVDVGQSRSRDAWPKERVDGRCTDERERDLFVVAAAVGTQYRMAGN